MSTIFISIGVEKIKTAPHYSYRSLEASFARAGTAIPLCRYILVERDTAVRHEKRNVKTSMRQF
jgi:hypothetical protein